MGAVDPTYPLYPIACVLAAAMLLLVQLTSFIRQSCNLGVAFLCFWLFFENVTGAVNAIVWSGNADIKLHVYCDIVSHLDIVCFVVKPMATLIITRRLYLIVSLQSIELPSLSARRWNILLEWMMACAIPLLVALPIYYLVQDMRFAVVEGFGCINSAAPSALNMILLKSWSVIPPSLSIAFYYPKVIRMFYRQSRDVNSFLRSNNSVSRTNYYRILALASIDVALTLPVGITNMLLYIMVDVSLSGAIPFYSGWHATHSDWAPRSITYAELQASGTSSLVLQYFAHWVSPVLAFAIFALFGCTVEARASYWRMFWTVAGWLGWRPNARLARKDASTSIGAIEFGARPPIRSLDAEMGSRSPSLVKADLPIVGFNPGSYAATEVTAISDTQSDYGDVKSLYCLDSAYAI
ncbi:unnamed protein product [Peniophora sp. CBMAI 1063]|nr:unnamed protein product [Peniophora sp. CBMAI 1063]